MEGYAALAVSLAAIAASPAPAFAVANPASVFCIESGGRSVVLHDVAGAEFGICVLQGGEIVEEWAYYHAHHPLPATHR